jgi:glycosyltransferase involved in cell wall biosynthesis
MVKSRHILFIVENNSVPFDRRVWHEACSARDFGYEVSVICPTDKRSYDNRSLIDGIRIYRHPCPIEGLNRWAMLFEYLNALFWESLLALRVFLKRPFSVIHSANPPDHVFLIAIAFKIVGVKFVFDHHDLVPETYVAKYGAKSIVYRILLWIERLSLKAANIVISTNESYKKIAIERDGKSDEDIVVVRNGPDVSNIPTPLPRPELLGGFRHLIGYVGVIGKQDGIENLLSVADYLVKKRQRRDIKFAVVGSGPNLKNLIRDAKAMALDGYVQFFGFVSEELLLEILTASDICINPEFRNEFTDKSTMIKIMEYMALKKPIVQFYTTEGEITAGDAAISIRDNDIVQFGDAILALLGDPARRARMGDVGRERIEKQLSWPIQAKKLEAVYDRIISSH